jgi:hypothetical protein
MGRRMRDPGRRLGAMAPIIDAGGEATAIIPTFNFCPDGGVWNGSSCIGAGPVAFNPPPSPVPTPTPINAVPPTQIPSCPVPFVWNGFECVPSGIDDQAGTPITVDPVTGQPVSGIPANGPLPPGAGFQQIEAPGSPFPYVYIGGGNTPCPAGFAISGNTCIPLAPTTGICPPGYQLEGSQCVAGGITPLLSNTPGQPPSGTYTQTCQNIQSDGIGNLWASCENTSGQFIPTSLNYSLCQSAPYNQNGQLGCGGPNGSQIFTPASGTPPGTVATGGAISPFGATTAAPWTPYTGYSAGQTVSFNGIVWTALQASEGVTPGSAGGFWAQTTSAGYQPYSPYSPYSAYSPFSQFGPSPFAPSPYQPQFTQFQTAQQPPAAAALASGAGSSFLSQYGMWILVGLGAVIILPRILPKH